MPDKCDFGLIGLAVMGENLALNVESRGYSVAVFNRTVSKVDDFINGRAKGKRFRGCHSLEELVGSLAAPRKVMLMVKAGPAVDEFIEHLIPLLSPGDVIIDGGNTYFHDTERRTQYVESKGLLFIGTGVSGGEEGALKGPSIMPGGSEKAWPLVKPIFQAISAKVGPNHDIPCCEWVGPRGAGHYVKMVHNGIEYGDMQLICEAYWILKNALGLSERRTLPGLRRLEPRRAGQLPHRDHPRYLQRPRSRDGRIPGRRHHGRRRGQGHGQMDEPVGPRPGRAQHAGDRGRLRPLPLGLPRRPDPGVGEAGRSLGQVRGRPQAVHRAGPPGLVRLEDRELRPGLRADAGRGRRVQVAAGLRLDCLAVARRLHHPRGLPGADQGGLRRRSQAGEPAAGAVLPRRRRPRPRTPGET